MALYTPPSSGDFLPFLKYNAKAGRFYFKQDGVETEVSDPVFVADFDNIKKAWMFFQEGQAPSVHYFPSLTEDVAKPDDSHKLGLELNVFSDKLFGGVATLSSNSINTCKGLSDVYALYEEGKEKNKGKLPVVAFVEATPIKGNYGTNYEPVFRIEKWVDRPDAFDGTEEEAPVAKAAGGSEF